MKKRMSLSLTFVAILILLISGFIYFQSRPLFSPNSVTLTWTDNSNNEVGFPIKVSTDGGISYNSLTEAHAVSGSGSIGTYIDNTVLPGNTYTYKIQACNSAGCSSFSNTAAVTIPITPVIPTITSISPTTLQTTESDKTFTITGADFVTGATTVNLGGNILPITATVTSSTSLTFIVPAYTLLGTYNPTVSTQAGTSLPSINSIILADATPSLTSLSPNSFTSGSSPTINIIASNIYPVANYFVYNSLNQIVVSPGTFTRVSSNSVTFTPSNSLPVGSYTIGVSNPSGVISNLLGFVVAAVSSTTPTITSFSPITGVNNVANTVTVTGINFVSGATTATLSGISTPLVVSSGGTSTSLTVTIPSGLTLGNYYITISTVSGTVTSTTAYSVTAPVITPPVTPSAGGAGAGGGASGGGSGGAGGGAIINQETCGDGKIGTPEECDDGNLISGDGCSAQCNKELGFICEGVNGQKSSCNIDIQSGNNAGNLGVQVNPSGSNSNPIVGSNSSSIKDSEFHLVFWLVIVLLAGGILLVGWYIFHTMRKYQSIEQAYSKLATQSQNKMEAFNSISG